MSPKTGYAILGALIAMALIGIADLVLHSVKSGLWIVAASTAILMVVSYLVAAATAATRFGEFMRGWLVGLNAVLNVGFGFAVASHFAGLAGGASFAAVIGLVNLLGAIGPVSQNGFYQGVIGYLNWLLPMSWFVVALGAAFYLFSFLLYAVTAGRVEYLKVQDFGADWSTGTLFIKGGLIANLNYLDTAFNMGNFSFVDYKSGAWHKDHEAGHTLNLAAFGSVFHLIGALDENVFRGANAYSERIAESNSSSGGSTIAMWA